MLLIRNEEVMGANPICVHHFWKREPYRSYDLSCASRFLRFQFKLSSGRIVMRVTLDHV